MDMIAPRPAATPAARPTTRRASRPRGRRTAGLLVATSVVFTATALAIGPVGLIPLGLLVTLIARSDDTAVAPVVAPTARNGALIAAATLACAFWLARFAGLTDPMLALLAAGLLGLPFALGETPPSARPSPLVVTRRSVVVAVWALLVSPLAYYDIVPGSELLLVVPLVLAASRGVAARRGSLEFGLLGHPLRPSVRAHLLQALNIWLCCGLLCVAMLAGTADVARLVLSPALFAAGTAVLWGGIGVLALLALVPRRRVSLASNVVIALVTGFLALQVGRLASQPGDAVALASPVAAEWYVSNGGRSVLVNAGHYTNPSERNALDLVRLRPDGRTHPSGSSSLSAYAAYGAAVTAPADGRVTFVDNAQPDQRIGHQDPAHSAGNHLVMAVGGGRYVMLAHLEAGSVRVHVGQIVRRGQPLARVGNSGNTTEPHLHVQVQDRPTFSHDFDRILTYPMSFSDARLIRHGHAIERTSDPRRGDRIRGI